MNELHPSPSRYAQQFSLLAALAPGQQPHAWQVDLAMPQACDNRLVRIPTGLGKTFGVLGAWWASFQPSIYAPGVSTFWGPSPTFFFIRLGIVTAFLPLCWMLRRAMPARVAALLGTLGASSLFVYWVHVELVYGGVAILIKRHLPFELTLVATAAVAWGMARLVPVAKAWVARRDERPVLARQLVARLL